MKQPRPSQATGLKGTRLSMPGTSSAFVDFAGCCLMESCALLLVPSHIINLAHGLLLCEKCKVKGT